MENLTEDAKKITREFDRLRTSMGAAKSLGEAFSNVAGALSSTLVFLIQNVNALVYAFSFFVAGGAISSVVKNIDKIRQGLMALVAAFTAARGSALSFGKALRYLRRGLALALGPVSALIAFLTTLAANSMKSSRSIDEIASSADAASMAMNMLTKKYKDLNAEQKVQARRGLAEAKRTRGEIQYKAGQQVTQLNERIEELKRKRNQFSGPAATGIGRAEERRKEIQKQIDKNKDLRNRFKKIANEDQFDHLANIQGLPKIDKGNEKLKTYEKNLLDLNASSQKTTKTITELNDALGRGPKGKSEDKFGSDQMLKTTEVLNKNTDADVQVKQFIKQQRQVADITQNTEEHFRKYKKELIKMFIEAGNMSREAAEKHATRITNTLREKVPELEKAQKELLFSSEEDKEKAKEREKAYEDLTKTFEKFKRSASNTRNVISGLFTGGERGRELAERDNEIESFANNANKQIKKLGDAQKTNLRDSLLKWFPKVTKEGQDLIEMLKAAKRRNIELAESADALEALKSQFDSVSEGLENAQRKQELLNKHGLEGIKIYEKEQAIAKERAKAEQRVAKLTEDQRARELDNLRQQHGERLKNVETLVEAEVRLTKAKIEMKRKNEKLKESLKDTSGIDENAKALEKVQKKYDELKTNLSDARREQELLNEQGLKGIKQLEGEQTMRRYGDQLKKLEENLSDTAKANELAQIKRDYPEIIDSTDTWYRAMMKVRKEQQRIDQENERMKTVMEDLASLAESSMDRMAKSITDAFVKGGEEAVNFGDIVQGVLSEILNKIIRLSMVRPITNAMTGQDKPVWSDFMNAIFGTSNSTSSQTGVRNQVPSQRPDYANIGFAKGGIAKQPGIIGEGAHNEAAVPLPDGRSIPVDMKNKGNTSPHPPQVIIEDHRSGDEPAIESEETTGPQGQRAVRLFVKQQVKEMINKGETDKPLRNRYGVKPRTRQR
jgi:hypothetical protein